MYRYTHVYTVDSLCFTLQPSKPVWREALSQEEREAEKNHLIELERKADYLKNPKYVVYEHVYAYAYAQCIVCNVPYLCFDQ